MQSSTRNAVSGNRLVTDTCLPVSSSNVMTSRPATITPIVIEPVERRRLMTSSLQAAVTTSVASMSTAVVSGPLGFMTSSRTQWPSAADRIMQMQPTTAPPSKVNENYAHSQPRQRPVGSGRQRFVHVGTIALNGVTRTLFIERSELPPPSKLRRNSEAASTLSTITATCTTSSTTQSLESEVACQQQLIGTVARTITSVTNQVAAVTNCPQSTATSGLLCFLPLLVLTRLEC